MRIPAPLSSTWQEPISVHLRRSPSTWMELAYGADPAQLARLLVAACELDEERRRARSAEEREEELALSLLLLLRASPPPRTGAVHRR